MHHHLADIQDAAVLREMSNSELKELAREVRGALCELVAERTAHFASNLGVVELCLALHSVFDFRQDRLIWDTGHQIYPHKLVTGRYRDFPRIRTRGGLMGYPNPSESPYDLFMTGHAGCSVSTVLGLKSGDDLSGHQDRRAVAVIGDGALPCGIVFEAMNNAGGLGKDLLVVLNDNKMSICPRVGGMASYLDRLRTNPFYTGLKTEVVRILEHVPVFGDPTERFLAQMKEGVKAGLHGGMLFEDLGFRYLGPIDGHDIAVLRKYLKMVDKLRGPTLLHVVTEKGHGYEPAAEDPVFFHTPPAFREENGKPIPRENGGPPAYTNIARDAIREQMRRDPRVTVLTAAMCQGNKLEPMRDEFPDRFFDTGICESHAVAFAAGQAKAGLRPIVDIYSTFLQRGFDQIFQEVALQDLPVVFLMDRAGVDWSGRPDPSRRLRSRLHADLSELGRDGAGGRERSAIDVGVCAAVRASLFAALSQGRGQDDCRPAGPGGIGEIRRVASGRRRRDPVLRYTARGLPGGRRTTVGRGAGTPRAEYAVCQTAGPGRHRSLPGGVPVCADRRRRRLGGRVRECRAGGRRGCRTPDGTRSAGWEFPIDSFSMRSVPNCWPSLAWMQPGFEPPVLKWLGAAISWRATVNFRISGSAAIP